MIFADSPQCISYFFVIYSYLMVVGISILYLSTLTLGPAVLSSGPHPSTQSANKFKHPTKSTWNTETTRVPELNPDEKHKDIVQNTTPQA